MDIKTSKNIICFGSLIMDISMRCDKIPAMGETVYTYEDYNVNPGGKGGNQSVAAARSGGNVTLIGRIAADEYAHLFTDSSIVMTTLEHSSQLLEEISLMARQNNCILIVAPSSKDYSKLSPEIAGRIDILKPNEVETEMLTGVRVETEKDAVQAIHILKEKDIRMPVISLGSRGVVYEYKGRVTSVEGLRINGLQQVILSSAVWLQNCHRDTHSGSSPSTMPTAPLHTAYSTGGRKSLFLLRKMYYNKLYSIFTSQREREHG
uniref:PfkB family carbohydrate kinase n=1 Tax=Enterocloster clostridioformis TaxID=1531 RepID=UPI000ADE8C82|nr:PfkB family carbohydrate kinase [Enterocloster clostridioformis]